MCSHMKTVIKPKSTRKTRTNGEPETTRDSSVLSFAITGHREKATALSGPPETPSGARDTFLQENCAPTIHCRVPHCDADR